MRLLRAFVGAVSVRMCGRRSWGILGAIRGSILSRNLQVVDSKVSGNGLREGFRVGVNWVKLRQWLGGLATIDSPGKSPIPRPLNEMETKKKKKTLNYHYR